jgi:hypothetical protein
MQRKYSEVVKYLPNFPRPDLIRKSQEPKSISKVSPVEPTKLNHATLYNNTQYSQLEPGTNNLTQPVVSLAVPITTEDVGYSIRVEPPSPVQSPLTRQRHQSTYNSSMIITSYPSQSTFNS